MSKKTLIYIVGIIILILLFIGGLFVFLSTTNTTERLSIPLALQRLNPFGDGGVVRVGREVVDTIANSIVSNQDFANENNGSEGREQLLFKLSEERSSGIGFAEVLVPKKIEVRKLITIDDPTVATTSRPRKISVMATTTETVFATTTRVRYVEQGSGHIYEYNQASSTTRKLTNTTLPKTQEAYFLDNGNKVLLRYLDTSNRVVENYLATIPASAVTDKLTGIFLSNNIQAVTVPANNSDFFYIAKTNSGSIGNVYNTRTNTERRVFSSPFSEWLPQWVGSNIFMTTKAASVVPGYIYNQSLTRNTFSRVTGNRLGLTSLASPDGSRILMGEGVNLSILNVTTGAVTPVTNVYTLPEKCVWSANSALFCFGNSALQNNFPESWYQGRVYTDDNLYLINVETGQGSFLNTPTDLLTKDVVIDVINPLLSKDLTSLVFINKIDMTPFYLNIGAIDIGSI
jgi:hypothetical protein